MLQRTLRSFRRLCAFSTTEPNKSDNLGGILKEEEKLYEVPIHLRPYDAKKYQVISDKIKINTGYALMEVEPFPRARIMRLCYNLLERLRQIPQVAVYRKLTQEKIKFIMKLTDEIEDINELEQALGTQTVQFFISQLSSQFDKVQVMKRIRPWEKKNTGDGVLIPPYQQPIKDPRYVRPPRQPVEFSSETKQ